MLNPRARIETGTLVWRSPVIGMPHTIVQVVTLPAIGNFVREAFETSYALLEKCENEIYELSKKIPADAPRYESSRMNKPNNRTHVEAVRYEIWIL